MAAVDLSVSFPAPGVIRLRSRWLFADAEGQTSRRLVRRVLQAAEISAVTIRGGSSPRAELRYCPRTFRRDAVVARIAALLRDGADDLETYSDGHPLPVSGTAGPRNSRSVARYFRHGDLVTGWKITLDRPGRLRLKNLALYRMSGLCGAIERELMGTLGIDRYRTNSLTGTVQVDYDPIQLDKRQVIEILDAALAGVEHPRRRDKLDLHLPVCTASLPIAAAAQFAIPALLPVAAGIFAYTSLRTFREAWHVLSKERRVGAEVVESVVVLGCLGTMSIFPGAVLSWCRSFGRMLIKRTQDNSRKLLLNAFGKQPRSAWLYRGGNEIQVSLDRLRKGDIIVVNSGEVVPVDGHIVEGMAMIDPHALTGGSTPAERGVGDRVFASMLILAGKAYISVEAAGAETASARIGRVVNETARYRLATQERVERLAEKAVLPTLGLGAVGLATMGPGGALAVLNTDLRTGIRMAAPLAMLGSLALCAHRGILVKDGRALERMNEIDTVLFDQASLLTRERLEVGRVVASDGFVAERILLLAAAAERKFHHPIARAILERAQALDLRLPAADDPRYKVGYGIAVDVDGHIVRVGSRRFLETEGISSTPEMWDEMEAALPDAAAMVMVAVDDHLVGAIELRAGLRPELRAIVQGLRRRGVEPIAILSNNSEARTRQLAEALGLDRSFADVLPADKAGYVESLQKEGRTVCFVGDGVDEANAMKTADVSISIRGASTIATDAAQIVFLEEGPAKLCELRDIARDLARNIRRSRSMILAPHVACVAGVFTMGFGIMASVVTSNLAALAALGNGVVALRKVAQLEAERRHRLEINQAVAAGIAPGAPLEEPPPTGPGRAELASPSVAV